VEKGCQIVNIKKSVDESWNVIFKCSIFLGNICSSSSYSSFLMSNKKIILTRHQGYVIYVKKGGILAPCLAKAIGIDQSPILAE